jgi:diaminopimelate decarboxylase
MELRWTTVCGHLQQLLSTEDEPLSAYLYDLEALRRHTSRVVNSLPSGCELFYAIKANSDLPILRTLAPLVHGFEVSSGGELAWIRQHFPDAPVIFSGPGKTDQELAQALQQDVAAIHVESRSELERLVHLARMSQRDVPVLLRVNLPVQDLVSTTLMMGGGPTPFGIPADQLPACLDWLRMHPEIRIRGFHFHLLSHQLDAAAHLALLDAYLTQAAQWSRAYGLEIDHVNVGGGIGINYRQPAKQFDWDAFSSGLQRLANKWKNLGRIRFECGRYLTAPCGYYAMQAIDIKQAFGRHYVVARGGTHQFRTPYAQGHSHPFRVMPVEHWPYSFSRPQVQAERITVVGQLCTPKDVLAFDVAVEQVRCGDMLVFPYAGAYAWHISHHDFLRHPHPQHHYLPIEEVIHAANE